MRISLSAAPDSLKTIAPMRLGIATGSLERARSCHLLAIDWKSGRLQRRISLSSSVRDRPRRKIGICVEKLFAADKAELLAFHVLGFRQAVGVEHVSVASIIGNSIEE